MGVIRVDGIINTKVIVEPIDVIKGMINEFLNNDIYNCWVKSENGRHFLMESHDEYHNKAKTEIIHELTQDDVDYYNSLVKISEYLKKKK